MSRSRSTLVLAALACLLFVPDSLAAQDAEAGPAVEPGWRVRVTTKGPEGPHTDQVVGDVERVSMDRVFISSNGVQTEIMQDDIVALDVSDGVKRNWQKGLLWGVVGGGLVGAIAAAADDGTDVAPALLIGMGVGGAVGAGVGALVKSEKWVRVPLMGEQAGLAPYNGGLALLIPARF